MNEMKVKLGDLTRIRTGKLDANAASEDGLYPFFTCSRDSLKISSYTYDCECVLVAGNGDLNVKYCNGKFDAYQRTYIIEDNGSKRLYMPYLYYFMDGYVEELRKQSIGGVIKYIKLSNLTDALIQLPDIEMQQSIVNMLEKVRFIIDSRSAELQKLDELVKARFVELFDNKDFPLTTIADLVAGKISSAKKDFEQDDIIKYIDISSIDNKRNLMTGYTEYVLKEAPSRAQQHVRKGDIVISTVRPNLRNVAITTYEDENLVASSGFCVLRASKCLPEYLLAIVISDKFTDDMTKVVTGANYPAIKNSDVMNYQVSLPPIELQTQFAEFVQQTDKSKVVVQKALNKARLLFDSLMKKYFG